LRLDSSVECVDELEFDDVLILGVGIEDVESEVMALGRDGWNSAPS
jgi:hypothetical protein